MANGRLAKSLHTVSVLANLGAYLLDTRPEFAGDLPRAVREAAAILGYESSDDVFGLIHLAVDRLERDA